MGFGGWFFPAINCSRLLAVELKSSCRGANHRNDLRRGHLPLCSFAANVAAHAAVVNNGRCPRRKSGPRFTPRHDAGVRRRFYPLVFRSIRGSLEGLLQNSGLAITVGSGQRSRMVRHTGCDGRRISKKARILDKNRLLAGKKRPTKKNRRSLASCPGQESNLHIFRYTHLKRARLPIPPPGPVGFRMQK